MEQDVVMTINILDVSTICIINIACGTLLERVAEKVDGAPLNSNESFNVDF